jgi:hypothetical protein
VAKFAATDYNITIGGDDLSASLASVTLDISVEDLETTPFGSGARTRIGGLQDGSVQFDFHQDFAADSIDATLFPLLGTTVAVVIKPTSAVVGATNPTYTFNALVTEYQPFASSVGDLATLSVTWPVSGEITRAVA